MDAAVREIEFLARSAHRVEILYAVAERPHRRDELRELTGASPANLGRVLRSFEKRNWIVRDGHYYEVTPLGEFVVNEFRGLHEAMNIEQKLRDVLQWLPAEVIGFDIELFIDAVVTVPEFDSPHQTVSRFVELVNETETLFGFAPTTARSDMEALFRSAIDGMKIEVIFPSILIETVLAFHPEQAPKAIESGNMDILTHDDLPCACAIFDDRIGLAGYDHETGMMRVAIDTDAPEARQWAKELYRSYRRDARPLNPETLVV
jgi:predicted transcriptional regulator